MSDSAKPSLTPYLKASAVGVLFSVAVNFLAGLLPGGIPAPLAFAGFIILVWVCLKVTQTALAYFAGREFATSTVFWLSLVSYIAGALLTLALSAAAFIVLSVSAATGGVFWGFQEAGSAGQLVIGFMGLIPSVFIAAYLFRGARNSIPAWRPLSAYWRPFYAGLRFKLDGTPQGPPAADNAPEDQQK